MKKGCKVIKSKRGKRKKLFVALVVIIGIIAAVCIFISNNVNPMILAISNERVKALASEAVSAAVIDVMKSDASLEYLTITRDDKNRITSVDLDSAIVNELAQSITVEAQHNINKIGNDGIKIPAGSLSGVTLLTGLGPDVNIKIYLTGSTQTRIISEFVAAGINQTVHRLYIKITGTVAVAVPGLPSTIKTSAEALISEMIIVGEVPPTYLNSTSVGDMLDLVAS